MTRRLFLVTGCGRSGTMYTARLLSALGMPCGHESQFSHDRHGPLRSPDSSWLAVPYLDDIPADVRLVRVIRNPYDVVRSVMRMSFQDRPTRSVHDQFVARHRPDIVRPDDKLGRAIRWVATWDHPLDDRECHVWRTDVDSSRRVSVVASHLWRLRISTARVERARRRVGRVNQARRPWRRVLSDQDIDAHPEGALIRRRAERFGYRE